jgi:hypothetical protein
MGSLDAIRCCKVQEFDDFFTVYVVDFNFSFEGATAGNSIKCLHNSFLQKKVKDKPTTTFFF